ncbi:protein-disulfide reductase DsbD domain-containing protein [Bosea sp. 117]|uniref:protein-disulfide reductase DsbD domain-containing protein n=1 Tax=Bosea sp. 117 TaxID=1125973 RepID=UPI000493C680|nr:protein-disulfide reductase DsbD domain-containing protein [Bosea sp. 117]
MALICAATLVGGSPARAETASDWSAPSGTAVRLIAGGLKEGHLDAGVEIRLAPGWKTYWRYPGDSGVPPRFDWSKSENVGDVAVFWPAPTRFDDGAGSSSIGYKHDVVLPLAIAPKRAGEPMKLRLDLDFAVCEKICQPAHASLVLDVPAGGAAPSPAALIDARTTVPPAVALGAPGPLGIEEIALGQEAGGPVLRVKARVDGKADLFVEGPTEDWALPLPASAAGIDGRALFIVPVEGAPKGADIARTPLRFTLIDGTRAVEIEAAPAAR